MRNCFFLKQFLAFVLGHLIELLCALVHFRKSKCELGRPEFGDLYCFVRHLEFLFAKTLGATWSPILALMVGAVKISSDNNHGLMRPLAGIVTLSNDRRE